MSRPCLAVLAALLAGCGSRCPEVAAVKQAVAERSAAGPGPHAQVVIPLARANAFLAQLLRDQPLAVPVELPALGPLALPTPALTVVAREVQLRPAPLDRLRFAIRLELDDASGPVTTLALETEVAPRLERAHGTTELVTGFGPDNLVAVRPELGGDAQRVLGDAVARWLPAPVRDRLPREVLDRAAGELGAYLTGAGYRLLQATLLRRLGELTRLRLRLPELPIASVTLRSAAQPVEVLTVDLTTDLPVRRGLRAARAPGDEITVRIAGSTAAELSNWAVDRGYLPQHYTRGMSPSADGEFRPLFDYRAEDPARPVKIYVIQERGGCSYFQVGLRPEIRIVDGQLEVTAHDQLVERSRAAPVIEAALWLKQLVQGSVERSRRAAAYTRLTVGGRTFTTRAVRAAMDDDELAFALEISSDPPARHSHPVVR